MVRRASFALALALFVIAECAFAQSNSNAKRDDLDVTMQIIVDPDAKLPDEVVRRIALPPRKAAEPAQSNREADKPDDAAQGQERAQEAQQLGREAADNARERNQEAADLREQARRAKAEEQKREQGPPSELPGRPPRN
jgi:hypothetical protein